jgi:hypothetical protein
MWLHELGVWLGVSSRDSWATSGSETHVGVNAALQLLTDFGKHLVYVRKY